MIRRKLRYEYFFLFPFSNTITEQPIDSLPDVSRRRKRLVMRHEYQIPIAFPSPDSGQRNDRTLELTFTNDSKVEDNLRSLTTC